MKARLFVAAVCLLGVLAGCDPKAPTTPTQPAVTTAAEINMRNVRGLCDFFHYRAHETLLTENAHGNVDVLSTRAGVPTKLRDLARAYYAVEIQVSKQGAGVVIEGNRKALDAKYAAVITECQALGWTP